jgi:hypothetical protein
MDKFAEVCWVGEICQSIKIPRRREGREERSPSRPSPLGRRRSRRDAVQYSYPKKKTLDVTELGCTHFNVANKSTAFPERITIVVSQLD